MNSDKDFFVICANILLNAISFYFLPGKMTDLFCQIDMTRQYKTMQTEMGLRVHQLETELERTNKKLGMVKLYCDSTRPLSFSIFQKIF